MGAIDPPTVDDLAAEDGCSSCVALEELVQRGAAQGCRITLLASVNKECECSPLRWVAMVTLAEKVCAIGNGHTADEAVLQAFQALGVPS